MGQEVVQPGHDRAPVVRDQIAAEKGELGRHVVAQGPGDKRCVGPGRPLDARGPHLGGGGRRDDAGADEHAFVRRLGRPDRRHGVAVAAAVGDHPGLNTLGIFTAIGIVAQRLGRDSAAGIGV